MTTSAERVARLYARRKVAGLCRDCGAVKGALDGVRCGPCAKRACERQRKYNMRLVTRDTRFGLMSVESVAAAMKVTRACVLKAERSGLRKLIDGLDLEKVWS